MIHQPNAASAGDLNAPIIVHSHLRWDFVWQRPQQLLSRLSERVPVLFIEEPFYRDDVDAPRLELTRPLANLHRAVPLLPESMRGSYDHSAVVIRQLVRRVLCSDGMLGGTFEQPINWFYTPMAAPAMLGAFDERAVVYDCMDELSKFRFAPRELVDREKLLMSEADIVFTGGLKLANAKSKSHTDVHFFGCGVDAAHFARAQRADLEVARDLAALPTPVVGYYGVIDERLDYDLLRRLAAALPNVSIAMVGPVVKVTPEELPQAPNLHWLGQRDYAELPSYVKGFSVCLMPFAINEATEFINPTKTLEYMAAGKPIVSTPISDVVQQFTSVVSVALTHGEFVECVRQAVEHPDASRIALGLQKARDNSWDSIVRRMEQLMAAAVRAHDEVQTSKRTIERVIGSERLASTTGPGSVSQEDVV